MSDRLVGGHVALAVVLAVAPAGRYVAFVPWLSQHGSQMRAGLLQADLVAAACCLLLKYMAVAPWLSQAESQMHAGGLQTGGGCLRLEYMVIPETDAGRWLATGGPVAAMCGGNLL
jgi:hypothetical protein